MANFSSRYDQALSDPTGQKYCEHFEHILRKHQDWEWTLFETVMKITPDSKDITLNFTSNGAITWISLLTFKTTKVRCKSSDVAQAVIVN